MTAALDDLVEEMAHLLGAPCTLEDTEFRLIGFSEQRGSGVIDSVRRRSILERGSSLEVIEWFHGQGIREAAGPVRTPSDASLGIIGRLCVPVRHHGRLQGYFWLLDPDARIAEASWPEAARIAESAAALLNLVDRRQSYRDALFRELVEGGRYASREAAEELAAAGGLDSREPLTCVLVRRPELPQQLASRPSRGGLVWVRARPDLCAAVVRAQVVAQAVDIPGVLAALGLGRRLTALDSATRIGVGPVVDGIDDIAAAHAGALVALRVASEEGAEGVVDWSDLGPLALLGVARDNDLAWALVPASHRAFLEEAPADLVDTLRVYLDAAGNVARTADRLAIHRQTVYHRLAQVHKRTGWDLDDGEQRLRLHLALRLAPYVLHRSGQPAS